MFIRIKHVIGFSAISLNIREGLRVIDYDTETYRDPEKERLYIHNTNNSSTSRLINAVKNLTDGVSNQIISKYNPHFKEMEEMIFVEKDECYHVVINDGTTAIHHNPSEYYITVEGDINTTRYLNAALKVLMLKLKTFKLIRLKDKLSRRYDKFAEKVILDNPHDYDDILKNTTIYKRYARIEKVFQKHVVDLFSRILTLYNEVSANMVDKLVITTTSTLNKPIGSLNTGVIYPYMNKDFEYVNIRQTYLDSLIDKQQAKAKEDNESNDKPKRQTRRTNKSI